MRIAAVVAYYAISDWERLLAGFPQLPEERPALHFPVEQYREAGHNFRHEQAGGAGRDRGRFERHLRE